MLTVFRTHPLIHVSYLIALVPAIVLLANGALSTTLLVVYGAAVAFAHSNTNLGFGPLERIFVSPNFHRIHHQLDGPQDVNLGFALTIWDQLFRRAIFPTRGDHPHRHRAARPAARRRAVGTAPAPPRRVRRPARRPVPSVGRAGPAPGEPAAVGSPRTTVAIRAVRANDVRQQRGAMMSTATRPVQESGRRTWVSVGGGHPTGDDRPVDLALLAVRIVLAWIFIYYGGGKLFGWFNGPGLDTTTQFMADTAGLRPGRFFAVVGGLIELGGGVAMALGIISRLAGLALFGDMVMAMITVTWSKGINSEQVPPGYELNLTLAALALVIVVLGAGRYSLDALVERRLLATSGQRRTPASPGVFDRAPQHTGVATVDDPTANHNPRP